MATQATRYKVLIIDDERKLRELLARILSLEEYDVLQAGDCATGLQQLREGIPDLVLCDVKLPDGNGVELVGKIKRLAPETEVILLTAYGNIPDGVQAIKNGAFDYITKGNDNAKIIPLLSRAAEKREKNRNRSAASPLAPGKAFETIIGRSDSLRATVELARRVAATDTSVLLTGETGTGKELFARAIHESSPRAKGPFVAINCSAFSRELLESELFGHKAGSFTGALKDKKGLFETADGGTLFLDEIGEMPVELQAKLLRVLENREFLKIGETKPTRIDIRVISATNRDLPREIADGRFREDLFYRLSVFHIALPPLRERPADIETYICHFTALFAEKCGKRIDGAEAAFTERLKGYAWPGNVRELRNVLERCVIMADETTLQPADLPVELQRPEGANAGPESLSLNAIEREHIRKVLAHTGGNKTEAARLLGIGLTTLYRKLEEYKF